MPKKFNHNSTLRRIKEWLLKGEALDQKKCLKRTGNWRLAAHIHYLIKRYGWNFEKRIVPCPDGSAEYMMEYRLPSREIQRITYEMECEQREKRQ